MIDPRKVTPLLTNMSVDREIGRGPNGTVYQVTRRLDGRRMALKHISIPASDAQTKALIYAGAVEDEAAAQRYYSGQVKEIKSELLLLNGIQNAPNLLKFRGYQVDQKIVGVGFDVYLLADLRPSLPEYLAAHPLSRLQAVNLAIDLCSALEQLRSAGVLHQDVRPNNIYRGQRHFQLGDLGLVKLDELEYSSMPEQLITEYTAPETAAEDAVLSPTMDIYSVGMVLYEIYNGNALPAAQGQTFPRADGELPAPAYADMALSEIILRACAYDPAQRYQTPAEMKQDLVLYLQRGGISDAPLIPRDDAAPGDDLDATRPLDDLSEIASADDAQTEGPKDAEFDEDPGPIQDAHAGHSLNDLSDDDLLVPTSGEISVEDFLASIRTTPGLEVLSMDQDGNTETVPGYETEETLPDDTQFVDSADARPVPDYTAEAEVPQPEELDDPSISAPPEEPQPSRQPPEDYPEPPRHASQTDYAGEYDPDYDDGYDHEEDDLEDEEDQESSGAWKKALIAVIVLLVLAGGAFAGYTFKTDTISDMRSEVLSSSSIQIMADRKNDSSMDVVCSTAVGEVTRVPLTNGAAVFTGLNPSTTYRFTMKSTDGKLLLGGKTVSAKTAQMTTITGFAASSLSAVTADLVISGTGSQPASWVVTCTAPDGQTVTATAYDASQPIHVEGLTPATNYTATIARGDGDQLSGTTTCTFTTQDYTVLSSFDTSEITTSSATLTWTYSGTVPDTWTLSSQGSDGSSTTQEISGTECTLEGLEPGVTYTVTLSCPSLKPTEDSTISVSIPDITVSSITSELDEDGNILVTWDYTGDSDPSEWSVSYNYDSKNPVEDSQVTTDTNSVTLENLVPQAEYTITIKTADGLAVGGSTQTHCVTGEAQPFTDFGASNAEMTLYAVEDNPDELENPTETFTPAQQIAFAVQVDYDASDEDRTVRAMYVIRDADGSPLYVYRNDDPGKSWSGSWTTMRHTGTLPDTPQEPGTYTLEMYFNGQLLAEADFTVEAG